MLATIAVQGQQGEREWKRAEEFLRRHTQPVSNAKDLRKFGQTIRENFGDTMGRLQAAFLWVTNNIRYDCEGLKKKSSRWALDSVLASRKAVCAGYVNVFRNLCEAAGVECIDVGGYGRSGLESLVVNTDSFASNHTWNAVRVEGEWKLVDVTWATGYTDEDCTGFTFKRNDGYFCADPVKFAWDHFPRDSTWQLLDEPVSWQEFYRYPLLYQGTVENNIQDFSPKSVMINKSVGDTIEFYFKSRQPVNRIIFRSKKNNRVYRMDVPDRTNEGYRYVYRIEHPGQYDLQIDLLAIDARPVMGSYDIHTFTDIVYYVSARERQ